MKHLILLLAIAVAAFAASFEVVSVKPSAPATSFCSFQQSSSVQLSMRGCTLRDDLMNAWRLESFGLSLPQNTPWISSARYDIAAKLSAPLALPDQLRLLPPVLEDRFRLKHHTEKRNLPVYFLAPLKNGLKLTATKPGSCTAWDKKSPPPPPDPKHAPTCDYILYPGTHDGGFGIEGTGVPMASFTAHLEQLLERPVIDKTGYTGIFDVHLMFTRESVPRFANSGPAPTQPASELSGLPSLFTAIKTLGVSLEAGKAPVDVFVVDSAQRPSAN